MILCVNVKHVTLHLRQLHYHYSTPVDVEGDNCIQYKTDYNVRYHILLPAFAENERQRTKIYKQRSLM